MTAPCSAHEAPIGDESWPRLAAFRMSQRRPTWMTTESTAAELALDASMNSS
jgi:hypothetical protein